MLTIVNEIAIANEIASVGRLPAANDLGARWHALEVEPRRKRSAKEELKAVAYFPEKPEWTRRGAKRTKVIKMEPLFPGYAFARLNYNSDDFRRQQIVNTLGVRFVRFGAYLGVIPDDKLEEIKSEVMEANANAEVECRDGMQNFKVGDVVRIAKGAFSGRSSQIYSLDAADRVRVLLDWLGGARSVSVPVGSIELV
jgi:transcription antitermination factor NusG